MKKNQSVISSIIAAITLLVASAVNAQMTTLPTQVSGTGSSGGGGGSEKGTVSTPVMTPSVTPALPPPSTLPIQSQVAFREYALGQVTHGARGVSAESLDYNYLGSFTYTNIIGNGAEAVLDKLFAVEFKYRLTNPDDKINGNVWLYDANNNQIFYGHAEYSAKDLKAGNNPVYWINMVDVPLMQSVQGAEVLAIGEDGSTANRIRLNINDKGQILFQPWLAGAVNGILAVRLTDGTMVTYKLSNPVLRGEANSVEAVSSWNIDGHHIFRGGQKLVSVMELWTNPTVLLEVTSLDPVALDITGLVQKNGANNTFERPTVMTYTQADGPWAGSVKSSSDRPTLISFPAIGIYRLRFEWKNFGQPNMLYTGPQDGGGKG